MNRLSGSLRELPAEETYARVKPFQARYGITRVTDVTRLDRIGIPVYASIRPGSAPGVICVHNGKGARPIEAQVGALMEGIEFDLADTKWNLVPRARTTPAAIADSYQRPLRFSDFCPRMGSMIAQAEPIWAVHAKELVSNTDVLVPAELIFLPFRDDGHRPLFGSTTNGLASGNSPLEASVHALCEVMERHVRSFDVIEDRSRIVTSEWPPSLDGLRARIEDAGLGLAIRYVPNEFALPFFRAYVTERSDYAPLAISCGYGFHPIAEVAASRAITEAVQSRLTYIHGGRDDIVDRFRLIESEGEGFEARANKSVRSRAFDSGRHIRFPDIPQMDCHDLQSCWSRLVTLLGSLGYERIVRVILSPSDVPFTVVKVVVPGMEFFETELRRVGPKLLNAMRERRCNKEIS